MHESERHRVILSAVQDRPVVTVIELCEMTSASEATSRNRTFGSPARDARVAPGSSITGPTKAKVHPGLAAAASRSAVSIFGVTDVLTTTLRARPPMTCCVRSNRRKVNKQALYV